MGQDGKAHIERFSKLQAAIREFAIQNSYLIEIIGDPSRIRTCNPRSRNPLLYPVELWDRWGQFSTANMKNPLPRQARSEPIPGPARQSRAADRLRQVRPQRRHAMPPRRPPARHRDLVRQMPACNSFAGLFDRHQSVTFSRPFIRHVAIVRAQGAPL